MSESKPSPGLLEENARLRNALSLVAARIPGLPDLDDSESWDVELPGWLIKEVLSALQGA